MDRGNAPITPVDRPVDSSRFLDRVAIALSDHTPAARLLYLRLSAADVDGAPLTQRALRERTGLCDTTVREQLTALEKSGWIVHCDDPRDPRYNVYAIARLPEAPPESGGIF